MLLLIFRGIFIIVIVAVLIGYISSDAISQYTTEDGVVKDLPEEIRRANFNAILWCGFGLAVTVFLVDIFTPKKRLGALAGVFFGLLVGLFLTWALAQVLELLNEIHGLGLTEISLTAIKSVMGICICYLVISIVMRTKDDVRFVIPYVEFAKQTKGARPLILDTSAIIDGRIADLCQSKLFDSPLVVPRFVLNELQLVADSADKLKRNRGRRGLDILHKMQANPVIDVKIEDTMVAEVQEVKGVDHKLVMFSRACNGRLATTDYNLSKVAQVREVDVVNINDLANCLKVVALPGETMKIRIIKPGEEVDQGIGYLDDGTMVVVEGARNKIGRDLLISITSSLQTSAGKMIFGKFEGFAQETGVNTRKRPQRKPARAKTSQNNKN